MRTNRFSSSKVKRHLEQYKIATMEEFKSLLCTDVRMTVFRKLKELPLRTSYSHRGKFYALEKTVEFDEEGLWSSKSVWFSRYGTLLETARAFVNKSDAGYTAKELDDILHVSSRESLIHLLKRNNIIRKKTSGVYVYFSFMLDVQRRQVILRKERHHESVYKTGDIGEELLLHELKATIVLFSSLLNEKQKRLYAGLESIKLGYGGDQVISDLLELDCHTVAKGRKEIMAHDLKVENIRKRGGGRSSIKKKALK